MPRPQKKDPYLPPAPGDDPRLVAWLALRRSASPRAPGAQELLAEFADRARLPDRDRALAYHLLQGVCRQRRMLDVALDGLPGFEDKRPSPALRDLLRLGAYQHFHLERIPPHALVHATVEVAARRLDPRAKGYANAALQALLRQYPEGGPDPLEQLAANQPPAVRHSFPNWLAKLLRRQAADKKVFQQSLEALNRPAPLFLRARGSAAADPAALVGELAREGIEARPRGDYDAHCFEASCEAARLAASAPFRRGACTIQDASAQLVARYSDAQPGMHIVDFCAAPGGKTAALADAMQHQGRLTACDIHTGRIERLRENLVRLGLDNFVRLARLDPAREDEAWQALAADQREGRGADRVLVDAPCSGLGTLRRHPEIRWRLDAADLGRLAALQLEILERAARLVLPGGWLVYATCSFAHEENRQVVRRFLDKQAGNFRTVDDRTEAPGPLAGMIDRDGWLRTRPERHDCDSASAVRLERKR